MSITKKSGLPEPGYRRILSLRDSVEMISSFFKYSWMGKKLKRRKVKKRKLKELKWKKKKRKKKKKKSLSIVREGFEPTTHTPGSWAKLVRF